MDTSENSYPMKAYKWLKRGAIDPDSGVAWWRASEGGTSPQPEPLGRVQAYLLDGLPYRMEDELWEVELRDISKRDSVTDWEIQDEWKRRHLDEVKLFARSGALVRRIGTWTLQVAEEFARACAFEARSRVLQALHDTSKVFSDAQVEDTLHRPERMEASTTFLNSGAELEARAGEVLVAAHTATLLNIWCLARRAHGSPAQLASAYAEASAASRAAAALTYATEMDHEGTSGPETEAQAYVDERRRQATWLAKRLGLADRTAAVTRNSDHDERRTDAEVSQL